MKGFQRPARAALALALFVVLLVTVAVPIDAGTTGQLRGRVIDGATKAPLAGVKVSVASPSQAATATTDGSGAFTFISLAPRHVHRQPRQAGLRVVVTAGI